MNKQSTSKAGSLLSSSPIVVINKAHWAWKLAVWQLRHFNVSEEFILKTAEHILRG